MRGQSSVCSRLLPRKISTFSLRWLSGTVAELSGIPTAVIAVGANVGNRVQNIRNALELLEKEHIKVLRCSRLYESAAAYVTDQPAFLNAALAVQTKLPPEDLLCALKRIEAAAGRDFEGRRWGPRPLDLDIIFYKDTDVAGEHLEVPHPRWRERDFVKAPLADLYSQEELQGLPGYLASNLKLAQRIWQAAGGEAQLGRPGLQCVLPRGSGQQPWPWQSHTQVMGILNVTPDSFSDGGLSHLGTGAAVDKARQLTLRGADILDIGGQSTRPGSELVSPVEELSRILPVIRQLRELPEFDTVPISVDTFSSIVAAEAVAVGADFVNDVSGGLMDSKMHKTVANLGVSYVVNHMRGTPQTMQTSVNTAYPPAQLAEQVGRELGQTCAAAIEGGIEPWRLIIDTGIGFSKKREGNCELINNLSLVRLQLPGCLRSQPLLLGVSRKEFLGWLTGRSSAPERDVASAVAAGLCISRGANIIRMHDVGAGRDAAAVADGICFGRYPGRVQSASLS